MSQRRPPVDDRFHLHRLVQSGWLEVILAGVLAVLVLVLDGLDREPWPVFVLDLAACTAAAVTFRWPRAAGLALGVVMIGHVFLPSDWGTMGEYAPLIPILGAGLRGAKWARTIMTACYTPLLYVLAWGNAPDPASAVAGWVVWTILIGVLWLIGSVYQATVQAEQRAREAELLRERQEHAAYLLRLRQSVAAELHDTVARSLTYLMMTAETALLRGDGLRDGLEKIIAGARESIGELHLVMRVLKAPDPAPVISLQHTPLTEALEAGATQLQQHGFEVLSTVEGDFSVISTGDAVLLGTAAGEAIANILKHADPALPCTIMVEITDELAELTFVNGYTSDASSVSREGLGLWGMQERLRTAGGEVHARPAGNQWLTTVRLPLSTSGQPGEIIRR